MKKLKFIVLLALTITTFYSCNNDDDNTGSVIIEPQQFAEIEDIATFHGNAESNIVIVNTQGGPVTTLEDDIINEIRTSTNTQNVLYVNVHQAQTLIPQQFSQSDITFEQAKAFDAESIVNLKKVVSFFKNLPNKRVYVLGISFGAFMTQELIAEHGIGVADGYLIMVGRLNIEDAFWTGFSQGQGGGYTYDVNGNASFQLQNLDDVEDRNMSRLAAGLGNNRYITEFANINDLSKITYVAGDRDEQVGKLTTEEIQFLNGKGATVNIIAGANHSDAIDTGLEQFLKSTFNIE